LILTRIISGLGNQLFQWAVARSLAEKNRTEVRLDISFYGEQTFSYDEKFPRPFKLKRFRIKAGLAAPKEIARFPDLARIRKHRRATIKLLHAVGLRRISPRIREGSFAFHPEVLEAGDNVYLDGYWASEKYFKAIAPVIREETRLADAAVEEAAARCIERHRKPLVPIVGMQIRRGDIYHLCEVLKRPDLAPTPLLTRDYFLRGMRHFGENCQFLVFSDSDQDIRICQEEFKDCKNLTFISGNDDITDFAILQRCDHQIISNSTFGWWAAWLNANPEKSIVAPKGWFAPNSPHVGTLPDLVPPAWRLL
jgi:hypothetical protein